MKKLRRRDEKTGDTRRLEDQMGRLGRRHEKIREMRRREDWGAVMSSWNRTREEKPAMSRPDRRDDLMGNRCGFSETAGNEDDGGPVLYSPSTGQPANRVASISRQQIISDGGKDGINNRGQTHANFWI